MAIATDSGRVAALLPLNPYTALAYHFGMLLGVDDFETEQGYHLGKHLLHGAWLHREGVVWGLGVQVDAAPGEIEVSPGLAVDGCGRELHVDRPQCIGVARWYAEQLKEPAPIVGDEQADGSVELDLEVAVRFDACLSRPVPALVEECEGGEADTAYSRVTETVEIFLRRPQPAPEVPYRRLRLLFGLLDPRDTPEDAEAIQAAVDAAAAADPPKALLQAFRRLAALDVTEALPAAGEAESALRFPVEDGTAIPLARIGGLVLEPRPDDTWALREPGEVDLTIRPSHVATRTIQELLCGRGPAGEGAPPPAAVPADAGGPRVKRETFTVAGRELAFDLDRPLDDASVERDAFRVSFFDATGWTHHRTTPRYDSAAKRVVLRLATEPAGLVRLIARGTGSSPLLGADGVPLAGAVGGPPGGAHDGIDFVHQHQT